MEENDAPERPDIPDFIVSRTVGDMLAAERRRQGKTLADIAEKTCIRLRLLEALEEGAYGQLPNPAYVRGYIQNYAAALDMSAEPFLEAYRSEEPASKDTAPEPHPSLGEPILPRRDQAHAIPTRLLVGVVAVIAAIILVWVTLSIVGGPEVEPDPLPPSVEDTQTSSDEPTEAVPGITDADTLSEAPVVEEEPPGPFEITVAVAIDDVSWLRVIVDDQNVFEDILGSGESRTWDVIEAASVRIGRPSAVSITKDGQPVLIPSDTDLPTVEITAD